MSKYKPGIANVIEWTDYQQWNYLHHNRPACLLRSTAYPWICTSVLFAILSALNSLFILHVHPYSSGLPHRTGTTQGQCRSCPKGYTQNIPAPNKPQTCVYIDRLVQERRNPNALAMELRLPCINSSIYFHLSGVNPYGTHTIKIIH